MIHKPLVLNNGKISQLPVGDSLEGVGSGVKWEHYVASLSSYDKVCEITYTGTGRLKRIDSIVYSSVLFPDSDVTVNVDWLDVGLKNQRIDKLDISGSVLSPNTIRKTYNYVLDGTKYFLSDYSYELL